MNYLKKLLITLSFFFFSLLDNSFGTRVKRNRDENGLAPELHKDHPNVHRREYNGFSKYTVCFYQDASLSEISKFHSEFDEFIVARLPNFNLVQLEVPVILSEDVILDIRAQQVVAVVENVLTLTSHDIHWNKARTGAIHFNDIGSGNQKFYGSGFDAYIYVIDSGVDDHLEFGSRIKRDESKGFGTRNVTES
eukprot:Awhi_evm1s14302